MSDPQVTRPLFPEGYVDHPGKLLAWKTVEKTFAKAKHYWLCTTRPDGRPHAAPIWGVWIDGRAYFDGSPQTRHARNIKENPRVVWHLESGRKPIVLEGTAAEIKPAPELARRIAGEYSAKYAALGYSPKPDSWDSGGLFEITPKSVIAWTQFTEDPTKFIFETHGG